MDDSVLMICDGRKAIGIAGIMGGENSMITDNVNRQCFLKLHALMEQISVCPGRKIGLRTDASAKFEKGLDPNTCDRGNEPCMPAYRGTWCRRSCRRRCGCLPECQRRINVFHLSRRNTTVCLERTLQQRQCSAYFKKIDLGYDPASNEVIVPSWRQDLRV